MLLAILMLWIVVVPLVVVGLAVYAASRRRQVAARRQPETYEPPTPLALARERRAARPLEANPPELALTRGSSSRRRGLPALHRAPARRPARRSLEAPAVYVAPSARHSNPAPSP